MYEPTKAGLEYFWPMLSKGGLFLFDEYGCKEWPGETAAVDEFFSGMNVEIKKLQWNNVPQAYLVKK